MSFGSEEIQFTAPWGKPVQIITMPVVTLLVLISFFGAELVKGPELARLAMLLIPNIILFGAVLFVVRGYALKNETLEVVRLGWVTRIPLAGLQSAELDPEALKGALRVCGNGGVFCFCGWFWSRRLGRFRAYVTDGRKAIVLKWSDRTEVVSPGATEEFLKRLQGERAPLLERA